MPWRNVKTAKLDTFLGLDDDRCMSRHQSRVIVCFAVFLASVVIVAASKGPPPPGPKDRCAVCGMFVAKYPNWIATIVSADRAPRFFDGPKDLFRFLASEEGKGIAEAEIWVTDYYTTKPLNAREVVYVAGSDVLGPMGAELVPLATAALAESFRTDHGGGEVLSFDDVDEAVLRSLE